MKTLQFWFYIFVSFVVFLVISKIIGNVFVYQAMDNATLADFMIAHIWGLKFDLATAAVWSFLLVVIYSVLRIPYLDMIAYPMIQTLFIFLFVLLFLKHFLALLYYIEVGRHISYEIKDVLNIEGGLDILSQGWNTYPIAMSAIVIGAVCVGLVAHSWWRYLFAQFFTKVERSRWYGTVIAYVVIFVMTVFFGRGSSVSGITISPIFAYQLENSEQAILATSPTFSVPFYMISNAEGLEKSYQIHKSPFSEQEILTTVQAMYQQDDASVISEFNGKNVVLVLLESWSKMLMNQTVTPNFIKLEKQGISVKLMLAGGKRTTEGMFASLCSWQNPLGGTLAQSKLENNRIECLPEILANKKNYTTAFVQGTGVYMARTGYFGAKLGFKDIYGKKDIVDRKYAANSIGVHDHDIYQFVLNKLLTGGSEPFFIAINTNTTHDTIVPEDKNIFKDVRLNTLHFADEALQDFLVEFADRFPEIYTNTLFVLIADHTSGIGGSVIDQFNIPFVLFAEDIDPKVLQKVSTQKDVAPSILEYLGLPIPNHFAGKSLFNPSNNGPTDFFHNGQLGWIDDDRLSLWGVINQKRNCFVLDNELKMAPVDCQYDTKFDQMFTRSIAYTIFSQQKLFANKINAVNFKDLH